jgi:23S rRNA pseudouridine1911/1915/1917 synthase
VNVPEQSINFVVSAQDAFTRLDEYLAARLSRLSRMHVRRLCREGKALVDGVPQAGGHRLHGGERVVVDLPPALPNAMTPEAVPLEIVHETASFLVVNKPAQMLVHPTLRVKTGTLLNALVHYLNQSAANFVRPGLVHRLDYDTSGLVAVAKTQRALNILTRHFHERRVVKHYLALLRGTVEPDEQTIDAPIGRDETARPRWWVRADGRPAQTRLRVLRRFAARTFVELEPVTGRTNQLRIHCAHTGHAILGDHIFGSDIEAAPRLCLHAARLSFHDPDTGDWLEFNSSWPAELAGLLK